MEEARRKAEELRRNTMTEVTLAGRQAVGALKEHISEMIIAKTLSGPVHEAAVDPAFVREMLLAVAAGWRADSAGKVTLSALLPAEWQERFGKEFEAAAKSLLAQGVEVGYSDSVRSGFRIGEKNGGYYISFSEADFEALLSEFLKERVAKMLYAEKIGRYVSERLLLSHRRAQGVFARCREEGFRCPGHHRGDKGRSSLRVTAGRWSCSIRITI